MAAPGLTIDYVLVVHPDGQQTMIWVYQGQIRMQTYPSADWRGEPRGVQLRDIAYPSDCEACKFSQLTSSQDSAPPRPR